MYKATIFLNLTIFNYPGFFITFCFWNFFQQQQRPDLSRLMQLQAAGAGLPPNAGALVAGIPHALFQGGPHGGAVPGGIPGLPPSLLAAGIPPTSVAALAAAAAHYSGGIRPPLGSIDHHIRKETETPHHKSGN